MPEDMQETEVRNTTVQEGNTTVEKQTVSQSAQTPGVVLAKRIVWFVVGVINVIVALRLVFLLLGASRDAAFTDFIYSISAPLVSPFVGMFGEPAYGQSVLEVSSILAIVIYSLIAWGLAKLLTISRPQQES